MATIALRFTSPFFIVSELLEFVVKIGYEFLSKIGQNLVYISKN